MFHVSILSNSILAKQSYPSPNFPSLLHHGLNPSTVPLERAWGWGLLEPLFWRPSPLKRGSCDRAPKPALEGQRGGAGGGGVPNA